MTTVSKLSAAAIALAVQPLLASTASAQEVDPCDQPGVSCAPQPPIGAGGGGGFPTGGPIGGPTTPSSPSVGASPRFVSLSGLQEARVAPDERDEITIQASQGAGTADAQGFTGPVWLSFNGSESELTGSDLELMVLSAGADLWFNDTLIFGVMAQADKSNQTNAGGQEFDALGYMVGPYAIYQFDELTIDARLLAGQAKTDVVDGADTAEDVESERYLASFQVTSPIIFNNGFTIVPRVGASWIQDDLDAYTLGADTVEAESISYGQADVGANFIIPAQFGNTDGSFVFGTSGIFVFGDDAGDQVPEEIRARIDLGTELYGADNWSFSARVFADGIGQDDFSSAGVDLGVLIWF